MPTHDKRHSVTVIATAAISNARLVSYKGRHATHADEVQGASEAAAAAGGSVSLVTGYSAFVLAAEPLQACDYIAPAGDGSGRAVKGDIFSNCGRATSSALAGELITVRLVEGASQPVARTPLSTQGGLLDASSWTRHPRQFSYTDTAFSGIFWASVIRAADCIASPIDTYYLYVSSDHDAGAGGIGLLTGPTPIGPWTWFGTVWTDTAAGSSQTETPSVIYDEAGQRLIMYYQQLAAKFGVGDASSAVGQQSTLACTGTDGLAWTKLATFINDVAVLSEQHGDGHTGYFFPFLSPKGWLAYSLYGGTTEYDYVQWYPVRGDIGLPWQTTGITLGYAHHMTQGAPLNARDCMVMGVVRSGGTDYAIVRCFDGTATGGNPQNGLVCIATISDDYRHITSRPVPIWTPSGSESTDLRSVTWAVFDGRLYVYFALAKQHMECISHVL